MSRRKQALFYCLMVVMTLLVIEGMAQAAYYIAYGEFNGGGPALPQPAVGDAATATVDAAVDATRYRPRRLKHAHPYYGFVSKYAEHDMNRVPPPLRQDGVVLIALLGGSVARSVKPHFQKALEAWFQDNDIPLRPVTLQLSETGYRQPQQLIVIASTLALGGEYDIIVNLDGQNELVLSAQRYLGQGLSHFYPNTWQLEFIGLTSTQRLAVSRIYALAQREQRLLALGALEPWRKSALYGIVNRYLREQAAARILALNHELILDPLDYDVETHGPDWPGQLDEYDLFTIVLRLWYRSSVLLHELSRIAGAEYYHFLQPNQYIPNSKVLSDAELANAYDPENLGVRAYRDAYPLLLRLGDELRQQGINYYDLTQIFADNRETLYRDDCCHLNPLGDELLAESMVQRLAPALRNRAALSLARAGADNMTAGSPLYLATQEISPVHALNKLYFDVYLNDDNDTLRYSRDNCLPADTAAPFFVRITPADDADLLPEAAPSDYNGHEFSFDRDGGITTAGQCVIEYELPDYAIANVLTGQYRKDTGQLLWRARIALDPGFAVERTADGIRYSHDKCLPIHTYAYFFLHITPVDRGDLLPGRAEYGYDAYDFWFRNSDGIIDAAGRCVVEQELPDYDIASIQTGQYVRETGRRLWEICIDVERPCEAQP